MSEPRFLRGGAAYGQTSVENVFLMEYMPRLSPEAVKAYLFGLMLSQCPEAAEISMLSALDMDEATLAAALSQLERAGLVKLSGVDGSMCVSMVRLWQKSEISDAVSKHTRFGQLNLRLAKELGARVLTGAELEKVYDWIDIFGFDEDAALAIVRYCVKMKGARVSVNYMDSVARAWADEGLLDALSVQKRVLERMEYASGAQEIVNRFKLGRRATLDEMAMYEAWVKKRNISPEVIMAACAELTGAQNPSFKYLDTVLSTYQLNDASSREGLAQYEHSRDAVSLLAQEMLKRAGIKRAATQKQREQVERYKDVMHIDTELILFAADEARGSSRPWNVIERLLDAFFKDNISSVAAAREYIDKMPQSAKESARFAPYGKGRKSMDYAQRTYSEDDLKDIGIKLID